MANTRKTTPKPTPKPPVKDEVVPVTPVTSSLEPLHSTHEVVLELRQPWRSFETYVVRYWSPESNEWVTYSNPNSQREAETVARTLNGYGHPLVQVVKSTVEV